MKKIICNTRTECINTWCKHINLHQSGLNQPCLKAIYCGEAEKLVACISEEIFRLTFRNVEIKEKKLKRR